MNKIHIENLCSKNIELSINQYTDPIQISGEISFGSRGELIIITESLSDKKIGTDITKSHENSEFITVLKSDAENILAMLVYAIDKLGGEAEVDRDIHVFGNRAISFERLYDSIIGCCYPVDRPIDWKEYNDENRKYTQSKSIEEDLKENE